MLEIYQEIISLISKGEPAVLATVISSHGSTPRKTQAKMLIKKDGTFVDEAFIDIQTLGTGSAWDIDFSPDADQTYMYVPDGVNMKVWILDRLNLDVIGSLGQGGRNAGQFGGVHNVAVDSKGNLYTAEIIPGQRVQKFRPVTNSTKN